MTVTISQCQKCKHYKGESRCSAFEYIPSKIFTNELDHSIIHYKGDNGIRFEPIKPEPKK